MDKYIEFLESKSIRLMPTGIESPGRIHKTLFPFQRDIVSLALRRGSCALFEGTGLGKTGQQCEWARHVVKHTGKPVLIVAPLAVANQTIKEAKKLIGLDVEFSTGSEGIGKPAVYITNYGKLHRFDFSQLGGIALDESSILKNEDGATRRFLVENVQCIPFRLACTATPAPNDYMEIGNHAEFLGVMTMAEMLATFFVHDGGETQKWRLKGHAEEDFWRWMASWAVCIQKPSDIGYSDDGYILPELRMHEVIVESRNAPKDGFFVKEAGTLDERRAARRGTIEERVAHAATLGNESKDQWVFWCELNDESKALAKAIDGAVEITGSDTDEHKEKAMLDFAAGKIRVLVTKPSLAGFGMNWQNCNKTAFVGLNDSFEKLYQSIRRFWRFGQKSEVDCHIIISDQEGKVLANIKRKEEEAEAMQLALASHMAEHTKGAIHAAHTITKTVYKTAVNSGKDFTAYLGDNVEAILGIPSDSIDYIVFSPPFSSLYTYSASDRDMGNCTSDSMFFQHYGFLISELFRVLKPGRLLSFHCMNLPTSKVRDGYIGIRDFRGELIRAKERSGFIYHSEVTIWKDPVTAMQRTKAIGLLHKQIRKDSSISRQGIPDYLVTMRKPGENPDPIFHYRDAEECGDGDPDAIFPVKLWQQYASPVWMDINPSNTLQYRSAREHNDERHICPLQLEVIERAIHLWTNKGDTVLSPFGGIGSEGYVAIKMKRKAIIMELKESYYKQACLNLERASGNEQIDLFDIL